MVAGHSGCVTDFDFSPFNRRLLATGSEDCTVKLWNLPNEAELKNDMRLTKSLMNLGPFNVRYLVINVGSSNFHTIVV